VNGKRTVRALVSGRVQGVYFRDSARREARRLGLVGWVRNTADGRVETHAQGPDHAVDRYLRWLALGPPDAIVLGVEVEEREPLDPAPSSFDITG
jgi:acylphosphatase